MVNASKKSRTIRRSCIVCGKKLNIVVYPNRRYRGGHYFRSVLPENKEFKKIFGEYWECEKCYQEAKAADALPDAP